MQGEVRPVLFGEFARRDIKARRQDAYGVVIFVPER
jgi:hypothetical protein